MERETLFKLNNLEINRLIAKCLRISNLFLVSLWIYTLLGQKIDAATTTIVFIACILLLMIPTLIVDILHLEKQWVKYYVIVCILAAVYLLSTYLDSVFSLMVIFPIIISAFYCDRKLLITSCLFSCAFMFFIELSRYNFIQLWNMSELKYNVSIVLYNIFLRLTLILVVSLFSYYIIERNMIMLNKSFDANLDLTHNQEELIFAFSELSENKSKVTGEHIHRVSEYMRVLGLASGFTKEYTNKLALASMMHDIGKLMIPEDILNKPDKLTDDEYSIMKNHVLYGEALLDKCPGDIMKIAKTIALQHHEHWDGSGYLGFKGDEIAYISRLMAVCDVFDALTSKRYYKDGWSVEEAYNEIIRQSGAHFDPDVVELFINNFDAFKEILNNTPDQEIY